MSRDDHPPSVVLTARRGLGPVVRGEVLVSPAAFSPRYDLDRATGVFSRPGHPLEGRAIAGKVLVFPAVQGGVAGGWAFLDLKSRGLAPAALLFGRTNPVMVQGAVLAEIPLLDGLQPDPTTTLQTGDVVEVNPSTLSVAVLSVAKR